jgi:Protein of unknown function (DUF2637).
MKAYPLMMANPPADHLSVTESTGFALTLRRVAIAVAGLAVAGLAAAACVLSFDDLRTLAVMADARTNLAYLYPAAFDALLVTALISFLLLRTARLFVRMQAGLVLLVLLAAAALAGVAVATDVTFEVRQGAITLAILPWAMFGVGLWLLLLLVKHAQARRAVYDRPDHTVPRDVVPFDGRMDEEEEEEFRPAHRESDDQGVDRTAPAPAVPLPQPTEPSVPAQRIPAAVASPAAAPADGIVDDPLDAPVHKPVRWGDLVRGGAGDVLVHPRHVDQGEGQDMERETETVAGSAEGKEIEDKDKVADVRVAEAPPAVEPGEGMDVDAEERVDTASADIASSGRFTADTDSAEREKDTQPYPSLRGDPKDPDGEQVFGQGHLGERAEQPEDGERVMVAPPSGRMRSTPRPPEE